MSRLSLQHLCWTLSVGAALGNGGGCSLKSGTVLEIDHERRDAGVADAEQDDDAPGASPVTTLPPLPPIRNVTMSEREDSVGIDFDPVDGAVDYRVYALPDGADVRENADGSLVIRNATYRCAGLRQTYHLPTNQNSRDTGDGVFATKAGVVFQSAYPFITAKVPKEPLLGYVYTAPAPDRQPVYAVGTAPSDGEGGWRESRAKIYTTDAGERAALLSQGGRDDGVVFYVPSAVSVDSVTLYRSATTVSAQDSAPLGQYYFLETERGIHANDSSPPAAAFPILREIKPDAQPLYALLYQSNKPHTELAVGKARFDRAANQGPGPLWHLEWSGISEPTTLVVEALASGCPYQGLLAATHLDAPPHQTFYTLDELRAASPSGEVYVNGQYDVVTPSAGAALGLLETPTASPVPIARAFLEVSPHPHDPAAWDWYQGFPLGQALPDESDAPDPNFANDGASLRRTSSLFDFGAYSVDNPNGVFVFTHGSLLGQFWTAFDDWKQGVPGRLRWTAQQRASVDPDPSKTLHVTWSVNTVGTGRRYPQLILTDQQPPIEDGFSNAESNFVIVQTIGGPSMRLEAQAFHGLVNGAPWAVNNQPKAHALIDYSDSSIGLSVTGRMSPAEPPLEHAGIDRMTRYDAYVSSDRLYVFMDGAPAACMSFPGGAFSLQGSVTITFGDVLFHEGADTELGACAEGALTPLPFLNRHQCTETVRHWDDLAFKRGVPAPEWDEGRFPCTAY